MPTSDIQLVFDPICDRISLSATQTAGAPGLKGSISVTLFRLTDDPDAPEIIRQWKPSEVMGDEVSAALIADESYELYMEGHFQDHDNAGDIVGEIQVNIELLNDVDEPWPNVETHQLTGPKNTAPTSSLLIIGVVAP